MSYLSNNPIFTGTVTLSNGPLVLSASQGIVIPSGAPGVTTDKLYQVGGTVYFNGAAVGGAGGGDATLTTAQTFTGLKSFQQSALGTFGSELITAVADRDFSSNTGKWTGTNWSITGGLLTHVAGANPVTFNLTGLSSSIASGERYKVVLTVVTTTAGTLTLSFGDCDAQEPIGQKVGTLTNLTYEIYTNSGTGALILTPDATWVGSIDNVSIKKLTKSLPQMQFNNPSASKVGEIRFQGYNLGIGTGNHSSAITGDHNIGVGLSTQFSIISGSDNIGIGDGAHTGLTTGSSNIAIGTYSQYALLSGSNNIAIGGNTQQKMVIAVNNLAIGFNAQQILSTGNSNVALGPNVQRFLTTGDSNVGIGNQSLYSLTTGSLNLGIGVNCLFTLVSGSRNTAIGTNCLYSTTGTGSVGIGDDCLVSSTASEVVGIGRQALNQAIAGTNLTAIGTRAGYNAGTPLTTITSCTFVGFEATSSVNGISNSTALGNGSIVTASNQICLGNTSITDIVTTGGLTITKASAVPFLTSVRSDLTNNTVTFTHTDINLITCNGSLSLDAGTGDCYLQIAECTASPSITTGKLYNLNGVLSFNGNAFQKTTLSNVWEVGTDSSQIVALDSLEDSFSKLQCQVNAKATLYGVQTITYAATLNLNISTFTGSVIRVVLTGPCTINFSGGSDGQRFTLELVQDGTGGRVVTLGTGIAYGTDITSYSNTTTLNKRDVLGFHVVSSLSKAMLIGVAKGY